MRSPSPRRLRGGVIWGSQAREKEEYMSLTRRDFLTMTGATALAVGLGQRARPAHAQAKTVKIGTAVLGDYGLAGPILMAIEKGFFKENGVAVEFTPFRGGPPLLQAVQGGQIHIAVSGATDVPVFREAGVPVRYVAATVSGNQFVLSVAPGITKVADLKGKSIGVTAAGSATWVFANLIAKQQGWEPEKDVKVVALGGLDAQIAALSRGESHAFVWGDGAAVMEVQGKAKILMRLDSITPKWIGLGAYCTDEYIKNNKEAIRGALRAYFQGVKFIRENSSEADKIAAKTIGWSEAAVARARQLTGPLFSGDGRIDVESVRFMQNTLLELGVIKKRLPLEEHYTTEFTPIRV